MSDNSGFHDIGEHCGCYLLLVNERKRTKVLAEALQIISESNVFKRVGSKDPMDELDMKVIANEARIKYEEMNDKLEV